MPTGANWPVFFVRDPVKFPSVNRSHKKHPQSNSPDGNMDFHNPESVHALAHLFGSRGIPASVRRITGFGVHTSKLVAPDGSFKCCKFHLRPLQEIGNASFNEATRLVGVNPDFHT
ncbi:uncharacterized protein ASPGLDRAFT_57715 [Aspergillus glaucus CBS 516.65]|uniref:Catalase core domain-containing protein n=1 Tax=Aspergillus glaucus CBS 516.65 TaxID=1160497 RepID=A0A1L9VLI1_ASPGL|nr:hypothetical protein ASPGLDRAFT_57715 [Aspergillus glaucus CBS 516.65]OJJ84779.1 hypothetical protein ASPGLDRAFT_57715 [Aspergillus glaucus CBS 516.65]